MKIEYKFLHGREGMIHSKMQLLEFMYRMDFEESETTSEVIKDNGNIATIYIPYEFKEISDTTFLEFELIHGFIIKFHVDDPYFDDEKSRGGLEHTSLDITSVRDGKKDKHLELEIESVDTEGFVYRSPHGSTISCFFSGIIPYFIFHKDIFTVNDYMTWTHHKEFHHDFFYHHEYGFTEEQLAFLFKFGEQDLRPVMIHDIAQIVHKRWDEYPENKYYRIDRMFMGVIQAEILCEFQDYFLLTSEFRKEIFEIKLNELKDHIEYSKKHVRNYYPEKDEKAVAFLTECLKHYK